MCSRTKIFLLIIFLLNVSYRTLGQNENDAQEDMNTHRLIGVIEPLHYDIVIEVHLGDRIPEKKFGFDGRIVILLKTKNRNTYTVVLHKRNLDINESSIGFRNAKNMSDQLQIITTMYNKDTEKYGILLNETLTPDTEYELTMQFNGTLTDSMIGFYKSSYIDRDGNKRWLATTQFNDKHTRAAFPCFDEPKFKATFNVTLIFEEEYDAISNTKFVAVEKKNGLVLKKFEKTPKMSTYLVAFLISDFGENSTREKNFTVAANPELMKYTEYALNIGPTLLNELNKYLRKDYAELGIDKMHLAAIPDFAAGAMENWGLLLFKEKFFLYDKVKTPNMDKQRIATVIAHEQSHMWFGNYITLEWWNHLWVNEGFARYFEYFIPSKIYPEWELEKQFVIQQLHSSMLVDALEGTGPMSIYEDNTKPYSPPAEFTTISYNKGASIIRMFRYLMGEDRFRQALCNLLEQRKFQNAAPKNVLASLQHEWVRQDINFTRLFADWTEQPGYPVVHVSMLENRKIIEISQKRFILNESPNDPILNPNLTYTIPITYTTNIEKDFAIPNEKNIIYLEPGILKKQIEISQSSPVEWIMVNLQQIGFYRVNYDREIWLNLKNTLTTSIDDVHEINRANMIDDLFNFARSGLLKYTFVFDILQFLKIETEYLPWSAAFNGFNFMRMRFGQAYSANFDNLIQKLLYKAFNQYGFEAVSTNTQLHIYIRSRIIHWMCKSGDVKCNDKALELVQSERDNKSVIDKNIRYVMYCTALRNEQDSRNETYEYIRKVYNQTSNPTEKQSLLGVLGCVNSTTNVRNHFSFIINSKDIRLQDKMFTMMQFFAENTNKVLFLLDLISSHFVELGASFGREEDSALGVLSSLIQFFTDDEHLEAFNDFIDVHKAQLTDTGRKTLLKLETKIRRNIKWKQDHESDLKEAFRGNAAIFSSYCRLIILLKLILYIFN